MKIFAIASNYLEHNKKSNNPLLSQEGPIVFFKADSSLLVPGKPFFVPDHLGRIEYEAEVVVKICRLGKNIPKQFAHRYYSHVTMGIDFTAREVQQQLKAKGLPWELSKSFDGAAAIGEWVDKEKFLNVQALPFCLNINGQTVQEGLTSNMLFKIDETIEYISRYFTLKTGDLLFTGSPTAGAEVHINDVMEGYLDNRKVLMLRCK